MIRTKYELIRRNEDICVEMDAEFEEDIIHKFYNYLDIYNFFSRYKFNEFIDDFRNEYNCRVRCHCTYYLRISNGISDLYLGRFLFSTLEIDDRNEPSFLVIPTSFDDRGNQISQINSILQHELYTQVKVCVDMGIRFLLFYSLDEELTAYERAEQHMGRSLTDYEREQLEDLERDANFNSDDDETPKSVETPFTYDNCCICLTEKPEIVLVPCLHKSVCLKCEEKGKLTKCPNCRHIIIKKIKI